MGPTPIQVRNRYLQKKQEAHPEWAHVFKKATNLHFPWNGWVWIICLCASYHRWVMSTNSSLQQCHDTDPDNGNYESEGEYEDTIESTWSTDIGEDDFDHQQELLPLGLVYRDKLLRTTRVLLQNKRSHVDTFVACPLLSNSRKSLGSMAPPLLKHQKSALLNTSSKSDRVLSSQTLPQSKWSGHQDVPHLKARADSHVPQHQKATVEVARRFMEAFLFMKTPWAILFDDKYTMLEEGLNLAIVAQDRQQVVAASPVSTQLVCELPSRPSLKIDRQTGTAPSLGFHWMLFYQIYNIDYTPIYTYWMLKKITIRGQLDDGAHQTVIHGYQFDLRSVTELHIQVKKLLFDNA